MIFFRTKLIEFCEELLSLFEDKNAILYEKLIEYRHLVKNKMDEEDLYEIVINFLSDPNVCSMIHSHNREFLKDTDLKKDVDLLWKSCTAGNKCVIWQWVDVMMELLEPYVS